MEAQTFVDISLDVFLTPVHTKPEGHDCGKLVLHQFQLRPEWQEGKKALVNKSFSVSGEPVMHQPGSRAKELLLTFTSGCGHIQHGPQLPTHQPLNTAWTGRMTRWKHHGTKGSFTQHTLNHKYFLKRAELHLYFKSNNFRNLSADLWLKMEHWVEKETLCGWSWLNTG